MSLSDLASLGSFVSGFAVLVSLIFLYFQLRQVGAQVAQAERNQQASIRQGRADRQTAVALAATDPDVAEALLKALTGASDITATQLVQFSRYCDAVFHSNEDSFYQHRDGLLPDSAFAAVVNRMGQVLRRPSFRAQWKRTSMNYGAEFVEFTNNLIARAPIQPRSYDPADWLIDRAAEMPGAHS